MSTPWLPHLNGFRAYLLLERTLSDHTVEAYLSDMRKLVAFLTLRGLTLQPQQIEGHHLVDFILWLNELGLGARSQARLISALRTFYKYLLMEDVVNADPTEILEGPRLERNLPDVLSYEEIQRMIAAIDLSEPQGTRNRAILETLYACGLRVSELTDLRMTNLFLDIGFVKVLGKGDKERLVPIGDEAVKHLRFYLDSVRRHLSNIHPDSANVVFLNRRGKRLTRVMVFLIVKECAKLAGLDKNVSPHTFRHSFATHLIEGGADLRAVQEMLGHESILTTEIYTHLDTDFLRDTIMAFHPSNKRGHFGN